MDDGLPKKNETRIEDLSVELDDLKAEIQSVIENLEDVGQDLQDLGALKVTVDGRPHSTLHWVVPEIENVSSCDLIKDNEDAQIAFRMAATFRDNPFNGKPRVRHGDMLLLLCNTSESSESESSAVGCYYMGVCVEHDGLFQNDSPASPKSAETLDAVGDIDKRHFIAWNTCGGSSCPEGDQYDEEGNLIDPKIKIEEVKIPASLGGATVADYLKVENEQDISPTETPTLYSVKLQPPSTPQPPVLDFEFLGFKENSISNVNDGVENTGYKVVLENVHVNSESSTVDADATEISVQTKQITVKKSGYSADVETVEIESDECGFLKRNPLHNSPATGTENKKVLVDGGENGSINIFSHQFEETSSEAGSQNTLANIKNVSLGGSAAWTKNLELFLPHLNSIERQGVARSTTLTSISELELEIDSSECGTDTEGNSTGCQTVTINAKSQNLTFSSGLLTEATTGSTIMVGSFQVPCGCDPCSILGDGYGSKYRVIFTPSDQGISTGKVPADHVLTRGVSVLVVNNSDGTQTYSPHTDCNVWGSPLQNFENTSYLVHSKIRRLVDFQGNVSWSLSVYQEDHAFGPAYVNFYDLENPPWELSPITDSRGTVTITAV